VKFPRLAKCGGDLNGGMVWSARELYDGLVTLIGVTGDPSVGVCMLGLPMVGVVVVEIWGEVSQLGEIWWRSQWGEWYGVPGSCMIVV
jgi:hypothetical protein